MNGGFNLAPVFKAKPLLCCLGLPYSHAIQGLVWDLNSGYIFCAVSLKVGEVTCNYVTSWEAKTLREPCFSGRKDQKRGSLGVRGYGGNLQEERNGDGENLILRVN